MVTSPLLPAKRTRAVIYARVSTDDQTTRNQVPVLAAWAGGRGYRLVGTYTENESAWRSGHQAELSRLIDDARKGQFDVILVWALDRVSREGALAILEFVNMLQKWGVKVLSYQESWTEAPGELAELLYALTGWVARMESARRSERTKAGLRRALAEGKTKKGKPYHKMGRPPGSRDTEKRKRRTAK